MSKSVTNPGETNFKLIRFQTRLFKRFDIRGFEMLRISSFEFAIAC
jgi:hypothetical protein